MLGSSFPHSQNWHYLGFFLGLLVSFLSLSWVILVFLRFWWDVQTGIHNPALSLYLSLYLCSADMRTGYGLPTGLIPHIVHWTCELHNFPSELVPPPYSPTLESWYLNKPIAQARNFRVFLGNSPKMNTSLTMHTSLIPALQETSFLTNLFPTLPGSSSNSKVRAWGDPLA